MTWWNRPQLRDRDAIICDGAVRSGKTLALTCGFFLWSMASFDGCVFAICGKTVSALRRNVIIHLQQWLGEQFSVTEHRQDNKLTVRLGDRVNTYYLFGGQDEHSYTLIQGITLAGCLLDEVVLMPRSFVEQAVARCSEPGSKMWFSCNPGSKEHWFYKEWVCKAEGKNALYLHFTMDDNPGLSPKIRQRYARLYTGIFYRRYVLGQWCKAEGLVYDFDPDRHVCHDWESLSSTFDRQISTNLRWYISVDYGTRNPFSAGLWCVMDAGALPGTVRSSDDKQRLSCDLSAGTAGSAGLWCVVENRMQNAKCKMQNDTASVRSQGFMPPSVQGEGLGGLGRTVREAGPYGGERIPRDARNDRLGGAVAVRVAEFYYSGRDTGRMMTDEEYADALEELAGDRNIECVIIDPSAASLIAVLRKRGRFRVRRAKNAVLTGIRLVASLLQQGRLLFAPGCKDAIREFGLYSWEDDAARDAPRKENDHAMDEIRYFAMTVMNRN